ncbi:hypothetical protein PV08_06734 [Exophiala spinifera]|uniref:C2H2-type domain-containing protein n=1 Tax=Exophiala spinifera TaxID=91928 RepID=A0A0D2B4X3_9EURO|nr:uncharacterized protein PV08_06734 [Exophiala spinifera]KIW13953.1 hypothetical protein PV08_06734 [Exophiala spinifera]
MAELNVADSSPSLAAATATTTTTITTTVRRARTPPRNNDGLLFCDHSNCRGSDITFKRVCEWNKHMDRHERPYKCLAAGCELNPGFTYSGGLLRHQREVHKMNLSTKEPLFCPFPNCNRSTGTGFTRRENLEEHKRRRHMDELRRQEGPSSHPPTAVVEEQQPMMLTSPQPQMPVHAAKRRRTMTPATLPTHVSQNVQNQLRQTGMSEYQLIEHLQTRLQEKEEMIRLQAADLARYRNFLRSMPPQAIYSLVQPPPGPQQLPGGPGGGGGGTGAVTGAGGIPQGGG